MRNVKHYVHESQKSRTRNLKFCKYKIIILCLSSKILLSNKKEWTTDNYNNRGESQTVLLRERSFTKTSTVYSIWFYLYKFLEVKKSDSLWWGKKSEQWLPQGVGDRDWLWGKHLEGWQHSQDLTKSLGCAGVCIWQSSVKAHLTMCIFHGMLIS